MDICIDFDGTCVLHEFPKVGRDIGAAPVLKELVDNGHRLILFTMRNNCENNTGTSEEVKEIHNGPHLDDAVNWFAQNEIPLYGINRHPTQDTWTKSTKAYAQLYIDDAALGCPLIHEKGCRPYVDWVAVREHLIDSGAINEKKTITFALFKERIEKFVHIDDELHEEDESEILNDWYIMYKENSFVDSVKEWCNGHLAGISITTHPYCLKSNLVEA